MKNAHTRGALRVRVARSAAVMLRVHPSDSVQYRGVPTPVCVRKCNASQTMHAIDRSPNKNQNWFTTSTGGAEWQATSTHNHVDTPTNVTGGVGTRGSVVGSSGIAAVGTRPHQRGTPMRLQRTLKVGEAWRAQNHSKTRNVQTR